MTLGHVFVGECRTSVLPGIFGYLNYLVKRDRRFIADILVNGLHRLEYRGYDSSGIAFDGDFVEANDENSASKGKRTCMVVRQKGKVEELEHVVKGQYRSFAAEEHRSGTFVFSVAKRRLGR